MKEGAVRMKDEIRRRKRRTDLTDLADRTWSWKNIYFGWVTQGRSKCKMQSAK